MNENDLILEAMKKSAPLSKKQYIIPSYDDDLIESPADDPIWKLARLEVKRDKKKNKSITEWVPSDFLRYVNSELKIYDLHLERSGLRETTSITKLHDDLLHYVGKENMSNEIMKEYFEWWIGSHRLNLQGEKIFIQRMTRRLDIEKFMDYKGKNKPLPQTPAQKPVSEDEELNELTIYEMSGLSGMLANKGIVVAHRVLKEKKEQNIFYQITSALQNFSKKLLETTMELTIKSAPYPGTDVVDFITLARPALQYHGIKKYFSLDYKKHFLP